MSEAPSVRTIVVASPSTARETGLVARAVFHIVFWAALVIGLERAATPPEAAAAAGTTAAPTSGEPLFVGEVALASCDAGEQRLFRALEAAVVGAEGDRSRTGTWPAPETMPPLVDTLRDGYRWTLLRRGTVVNYLGLPDGAAGRPTFVAVILEPDPGTPIDPLAPTDEIHHRLADGSMLHVSIWKILGARPATEPLAAPAVEDGWRRIRATAAPVPSPTATATGRPLKIGVTLHPYYSWVKSIVGDSPGIEVRPLLPGEIDAGNYQPAADDIQKLTDLDAVVVNGLGHDDFMGDLIKASGNTRLVVVRVNEETPLLKSTYGDTPNSHTFISFTNAIQQTDYIARKLSELRPEDAEVFRRNAAAYEDRLRALKADAAGKLAGAKVRRVVTVHDGYGYLLKELGIEIAGVLEPAHGLVPSAKELGDLIALIQKEGLTVVLSEQSFPEKLLATLRDATGARVYLISHVATGTYSADEYERVMKRNADTLVQALVTDPR